MEIQTTLTAKPEDKDVGFPVTDRKANGRFESYKKSFRRLGERGGREVFPILNDDKDGSEGDGVESWGQVGAAVTGRSVGGNNARGNYVAKGNDDLIYQHPRNINRKYFYESSDISAALRTVQRFPSEIIKKSSIIPRIHPNQRIRRLTPIECERLQGFPELESLITFYIHNNEICLDLQKRYVNVESQNLRLQRSVGNAESEDLQENVLSVEQSLNTNNLQTDRLALQNVRINCVEKRVELLNREKSFSYASFVESQDLSPPLIKEEDFAQILVGIDTTLEKIIGCGRVGLPQNEQDLIHLKNGVLYAKRCGEETMPLVADAKNGLTILNQHLKYIMSNPSKTAILDTNYLTSFCYVLNAMIGYIQLKILPKNTLNLELYFRRGWTAGISDTQRYKCLGNAVTTTVVSAIGRALLERKEPCTTSKTTA